MTKKKFFFFLRIITVKTVMRDCTEKKYLIFQEVKKNVHFFVHFVYILKKCFFFGRKILSILNAWLYRVFFVFFFWKFMIFLKWTKKFFFNVNPYHFQTHAWLYRRKIFFLPNDTYHLLSFFCQKKKKIFFFLGPQNGQKDACEEPTKWSKNHHFAGLLFEKTKKIPLEP